MNWNFSNTTYCFNSFVIFNVNSKINIINIIFKALAFTKVEVQISLRDPNNNEKYIGSDDFKAWGVTTHNVVVESAPITEEAICVHKIQQSSFERHNF